MTTKDKMKNETHADDHPIYSHMFTIAFEVNDSKCRNGDDMTAKKLRSAIIRRIYSIPDDELVDQAIGGPDDTYQVNE